MTHSADPDQIAPEQSDSRGAVQSGSSLFAQVYNCDCEIPLCCNDFFLAIFKQNE